MKLQNSYWAHIILLAFTLKQMLSSGISMFKRDVSKSNILKEISNTTISRCYKECWLNENDCVAVGFPLDEVNNKHINSLHCYMLTTVNSIESETDILTLDVMVCNVKLLEG